MTRGQFLQASRRVRLYASLLMGLAGSSLIILGSLLVLWARPAIQGLGQLLSNQFRDERTVGLVGGLVGGILLAPMLLIPLMPALWVHRRFGLRCPGCRRSVTTRCRPDEVLRTGRCCHCQQLMFEQVDK
jgi:hypothetical protein